MNIRNTMLAAAAVVVATSIVAIYPTQANAMPRVQLDAQAMKAGDIVKVGAKKRRIRRYIRRSLRRHHRRHHRHGRGRGYGPYAGAGCHAHTYKVPGMGLHTRVRCNHWHYRAYNSWYWN